MGGEGGGLTLKGAAGPEGSKGSVAGSAERTGRVRPLYSYRKAAIGSKRIARRAGT
jgi:hypothetical protein